MDYAEMLDAIERKMGPAPRRLGWFRRSWRMQRPDWLRQDPDMQRIFDANELLLREGRLAWAALVQANTMLFSAGGPKGSVNAPGAIVYSRDPAARENPEPLIPLAGLLFSLKGANVKDPQGQRIGDILADEFIRPIEEAVPEQYCPEYPTIFTTLFFDRKHLPGRRLVNVLLPVLILPEETPVVVLAPGALWPDALTQEWR